MGGLSAYASASTSSRQDTSWAGVAVTCFPHRNKRHFRHGSLLLCKGRAAESRGYRLRGDGGLLAPTSLLRFP